MLQQLLLEQLLQQGLLEQLFRQRLLEHGTTTKQMFVPTIIVETVVPTMIVETAVPTIIVLRSYYWKSRLPAMLVATLGSILDSQLSSESCKFQLANWSHGVALLSCYKTTHPQHLYSLTFYVRCPHLFEHVTRHP